LKATDNEVATGPQCFAVNADRLSQNLADKRPDSHFQTGNFVSTVSLRESATKASIGKRAADVAVIRAAFAASGFIEFPVLD